MWCNIFCDVIFSLLSVDFILVLLIDRRIILEIYLKRRSEHKQERPTPWDRTWSLPFLVLEWQHLQETNFPSLPHPRVFFCSGSWHSHSAPTEVETRFSPQGCRSGPWPTHSFPNHTSPLTPTTTHTTSSIHCWCLHSVELCWTQERR